MRQNELYHHGIKGMRWGVRRRQKNKTSSNTARKKKSNKSSYNKYFGTSNANAGKGFVLSALSGGLGMVTVYALTSGTDFEASRYRYIGAVAVGSLMAGSTADAYFTNVRKKDDDKNNK